MHKIHITGPRPDFRVIGSLLYHDMRNVDTEGNANPVWSRNWNCLYLQDRESDDPSIEITEKNGFLIIESESNLFEELISLYLYDFCGDRVFQNETEVSSVYLSELRMKYSGQIQRAEASIWHRSSKKFPYPNTAEQGAAANP